MAEIVCILAAVAAASQLRRCLTGNLGLLIDPTQAFKRYQHVRQVTRPPQLSKRYQQVREIVQDLKLKIELENFVQKLCSSPRTFNPFVFEVQPNPVYFGHLIPSGLGVYDARRRHVPIDPKYLKWHEEREDELSSGDDAMNMDTETNQEHLTMVIPEPPESDQRNEIDTGQFDEDVEADDNLGIDSLEAPIRTPVAALKSAERTTTLCTHCDLRFPTPGKLNEHVHRKHIQRFKCDNCPRKFFFNADLTRHNINVHRDSVVQTKQQRTFTCPNMGCKMAGKPFLRKDNFVRHLQRCRK